VEAWPGKQTIKRLDYTEICSFYQLYVLFGPHLRIVPPYSCVSSGQPYRLCCAVRRALCLHIFCFIFKAESSAGLQSSSPTRQFLPNVRADRGGCLLPSDPWSFDRPHRNCQSAKTLQNRPRRSVLSFPLSCLFTKSLFPYAPPVKHTVCVSDLPDRTAAATQVASLPSVSV
jgi:hypothetical protein